MSGQSKIWVQSSSRITMRPWMDWVKEELEWHTEDDDFVMTFNFSNRSWGEFYLTINKEVKLRLVEDQPERVMLYMTGKNNNPECFIPILCSKPQIRDFDLLRLRQKGMGL